MPALLFCSAMDALPEQPAGPPPSTIEPTRIVSLAPACAEILHGLGLEDRLVGITEYTDFPPGVEKLPRVGSYVNLNVEAIVALRPDLVVATSDGNTPAVLARLEAAGLRVHVLRLERYENVAPSILALGAKVGREERARKITEEMQRVADCIQKATAGATRPRVLFAYELGPLVAPGEGAFSNALIRLAGGDSVTASVKTPYPRISMETAIAMSPDVMIVGGMNPANEKLVKQELGKWTHLPAVRDGRVYLIDSTNLDRPSQRMMLGLRLLAKLLHPEAFADPSICATTMLQ